MVRTAAASGTTVPFFTSICHEVSDAVGLSSQVGALVPFAAAVCTSGGPWEVQGARGFGGKTVVYGSLGYYNILKN